MARILDEIAYLHMHNIIKNRPLDIKFETVTTCPLKCVFCCNRLYRREYTVMDNELFEKIIKQYCDAWGGGTLSIGSMQSDFLADPLLIERMRIIKKYKKKLWVYSTTPLISCRKYSDKELLYILCLFDYLQISVEGHNETTYERMTGVNGFHIFKEQLSRIKRIIDENSLAIKIELCCRTYNKGELIHSDFYKEISSMFYVGNVKDSFFSWFGSIKKEDLPKGARLVTKYNDMQIKNCVVPNTTLAVQADGKVVGCGCIDWLEKYIIGDCRKNTLEEIWKGPKAIKFKKAFQNGKLPSICKECGLYSPIDICMKDKNLIHYKPSDGLFYLAKGE